MNTIENWSWDKPTEQGDYLANYGDVVSTPFFIRVMDFEGELLIVDGDHQIGARFVGNIHKGYKFARLDYK